MDTHRFIPADIHGDLLPILTNGVMTQVKRVHDGAFLIVHNSNLELIKPIDLAPRRSSARSSRPSKKSLALAELDFLKDLL